jgi:hypothetical protein
MLTHHKLLRSLDSGSCALPYAAMHEAKHQSSVAALTGSYSLAATGGMLVTTYVERCRACMPSSLQPSTELFVTVSC